MTTWKPRPREQVKTKAELQEMLAQAVRNTQPQGENKPLQKAQKRPRPRIWQAIGHPEWFRALAGEAVGVRHGAELQRVVSGPSIGNARRYIHPCALMT